MTHPVSFDNTEIAFAHKKSKELTEAHWLFVMMGKSWVVKWGARLAPWSIKARLPVKGIIRNTIFKQFVGGETLNETTTVAAKLAQSGVQVILDYGVEGKEGEASFDHARDEFIRVIRYAATQPNIPFISVKITGFARFSLLEKMDSDMHAGFDGSLVATYHKCLKALPPAERAEWEKVAERMRSICATAAAEKVGVLVDAEETWIQDPVDALTMLMMDEFNRERAVVYNTIQLYRHDRLPFLRQSYTAAEERSFILGVKLVRGAYMEKERRRANENSYLSPIQENKASTDKDYNEALRFSFAHISRIGLIVATHNEESNLLATQMMQQHHLPAGHAQVHFSQLFGMSDNITYNLAAGGYNVSKYLPFGPIEEVIPYLMRRAQENTSVGGQTSRELGLIKKELKRRQTRTAN